jgi:hypothetical protein
MRRSTSPLSEVRDWSSCAARCEASCADVIAGLCGLILLSALIEGQNDQRGNGDGGGESESDERVEEYEVGTG